MTSVFVFYEGTHIIRNRLNVMKKTALLASDMDGTVIPLDLGKERDKELLEFNRLIQKNSHIALAYVTGRHLELGLAGVKQYRLPSPDIFVCDVGTTIYFQKHGDWHKDEEYRQHLKQSWQGKTGSDIASILQDIHALEPQEEDKQKEFKQSYYIARDIDIDTIVNMIHEHLAGYAIEANVIYSVDSKKKVGLVDVLPQRAAKDYALSYLWKKLEFMKDSVVYAGDSGNDLLAFLSGFNAIIVDNTADAVKETVRRQAREKGIEERIFFASTRFVQGVMEGCFYFNLFRE